MKRGGGENSRELSVRRVSAKFILYVCIRYQHVGRVQMLERRQWTLGVLIRKIPTFCVAVLQLVLEKPRFPLYSPPESHTSRGFDEQTTFIRSALRKTNLSYRLKNRKPQIPHHHHRLHRSRPAICPCITNIQAHPCPPHAVGCCTTLQHPPSNAMRNNRRAPVRIHHITHTQCHLFLGPKCLFITI